MDIIFTRAFWGVIIILIGVSMVLNAVFKINIPFFRIFFSLLLIYLGITILIGVKPFKRNWAGSGAHSTLFSDTRVHSSEADLGRKYDVVFGSQFLDLSGIHSLKEDKKIETNTIFGSQKLMLSSDLNVKIKSSSVFSSVHIPQRSSPVIGEVDYVSPDYQAGEPVLFIESNVIFGSFEVFIK